MSLARPPGKTSQLSSVTLEGSPSAKTIRLSRVAETERQADAATWRTVTVAALAAQAMKVARMAR